MSHFVGHEWRAVGACATEGLRDESSWSASEDDARAEAERMLSVPYAYDRVFLERRSMAREMGVAGWRWRFGPARIVAVEGDV